MSVLVRVTTPDDWRVRRDVRLAALLDSPGAFLSTYADSVTRDEAAWRAFPADGVIMCAWVDGTPVGMAGVSLHDPDDAELFAMWVAPSARGSGVADALIGAALAWAEGEGYASIALEVTAGNVRAERAYARHGFVPTDEPTMTSGGLAMRRTFPVVTPGSAL